MQGTATITIGNNIGVGRLDTQHTMDNLSFFLLKTQLVLILIEI
jgi:hypothetical protein